MRPAQVVSVFVPFGDLEFFTNSVDGNFTKLVPNGTKSCHYQMVVGNIGTNLIVDNCTIWRNSVLFEFVDNVLVYPGGK